MDDDINDLKPQSKPTLADIMAEIGGNRKELERIVGGGKYYPGRMSQTQLEAIRLLQAAKQTSNPDRWLETMQPYDKANIEFNLNNSTEAGYVDKDDPNRAVIQNMRDVANTVPHELTHTLQLNRGAGMGLDSDMGLLDRAQTLSPDMRNSVFPSANRFDNPLEAWANINSRAHNVAAEGGDFINSPEGKALFPDQVDQRDYYTKAMPGVNSWTPDTGTFVPNNESFMNKAKRVMGFADGGMITDIQDPATEAIKDTVRDPQAAKMLDMDLARLATMNQPQRMAGGGSVHADQQQLDSMRLQLLANGGGISIDDIPDRNEFSLNSKPAKLAYTEYDVPQIDSEGKPVALPKTVYDLRMADLEKQLETGIKPDWMSGEDFIQDQAARKGYSGRATSFADIGSDMLAALGNSKILGGALHAMSAPYEAAEKVIGSSMGLDPTSGLIGKMGEFHNVPNATRYMAGRAAPFAKDAAAMANELYMSGNMPGTVAPASYVTAPSKSISYPVAPRNEWYGEGTYDKQGGVLKAVSPDEYLSKVKPLKIDEASRENIDLLKEHILSGKTLDPLLIRANGKEDGRHRAYAAKELGIKEVPVIDYGDHFKKENNIPITDGISPQVKGVAPGEELIAHHNLSADKLLGADKLGGMPVPSLAISKASDPLTNFGEITLIAPQEMAVPSAKNPVFRSDAYTATKPNISYSIDRKSELNLKNLLSSTIEKIPDGEHEFGNSIGNIGDLNYQPLIRSKFLEDKGILPNKAEFKNKYDFEGEVNSLVNQNRNEFESWLDNFKSSLPDSGVDIQEKIFKGYTNLGNRRYADATLDNFVKEMKGLGNRQGWFGGPAYLRAVATPKFKNIKEVKSERNKIVNPEEFAKIKDESDKKFFDLTGQLREFGRYDPSDALLEIAETRNPNVLDRIYGEGTVSPELKKEISSFITGLKSLPTEYFEAKPQRAVGLSEFAGAIIPKDSSAKVRSTLEKNGITDIHEYSTPQERVSLFKKYGKHMFAAPPVAVGAGMMSTQQDDSNMKNGGKVQFANDIDAMRRELTKAK